MRFANNIHDMKSQVIIIGTLLFPVENVSFYFLRAISCPEQVIPLKRVSIAVSALPLSTVFFLLSLYEYIYIYIYIYTYKTVYLDP